MFYTSLIRLYRDHSQSTAELEQEYDTIGVFRARQFLACKSISRPSLLSAVLTQVVVNERDYVGVPTFTFHELVTYGKTIPVHDILTSANFYLSSILTSKRDIGRILCSKGYIHLPTCYRIVHGMSQSFPQRRRLLTMDLGLSAMALGTS